MAETIGTRLKNAWNAFMNRDPTMSRVDLGMSYSHPLYTRRLHRGFNRSVTTTICNRIAVDVSEITIQHVRLDDNNRYIETIDSGLNRCLNLSANVDQTGRAFILDAVLSMFDEGVIALMPVDTSSDPNDTESVWIDTIRVGKIVQWYPQHVRIRAYNELTGRDEEVTMSKNSVAIIENPFYAIMNQPNSTMQELIHKSALLDDIDEQLSSGKLDMIIQLPYLIHSKKRKTQAEERRKDIEDQLMGSKYGIAYTDGTEKIVQLNRSLENNIALEVDKLKQQLYNQFGLTEAVFDGTADEAQMNNYYSRTIEPICNAFCDEMIRKFLSKNARTRKQTIMYFRDPFRLVPTSQMAELADKFTRNEIMSSNELRQVVGLKPVDDARADELRNKNLNAQEGEQFATVGEEGNSATPMLDKFLRKE